MDNNEHLEHTKLGSHYDEFGWLYKGFEVQWNENVR